MRALRSRIAAWTVGLACLVAAAPSLVAQTWVRPGDIIFDAFGCAPHGTLDASLQPATRLAGAQFIDVADGPEPAVLPLAIPSPAEAPFPPAALPGAPAHRQVHSASIRDGEWDLLPGSLLYRPYLAGEKEPRIGLSVLNDSKRGWLWESALGGRLGILRRGDPGLNPARAWQIDLEGAALARVNPTMESTPLEATDYRIGLHWTKRSGPTAYKAGYYHISSHVGDEYLLLNPGFNRINYVRDSLLFGIMRDVTEDVQVYGELGYALGVSGGAEPLEVQFGAQYLPVDDTGLRGSPFAAVNVHLREEVGFGGGINVMAGWRWRGTRTGRVARIGLQYYNGKSIQYEFLDEDQQLFGYGVWVDF